MGLTIYDKTNTSRTGVRSVSINKRTSLFGFSKRVISDLGWKDGTKIIFAQDDDDPKRWYVASTKDESKDVFLLRIDYKGALLMQSRGAARQIINGFDDSLECIRFLIGLTPNVGDDGTKFYPLIPTSIKK